MPTAARMRGDVILPSRIAENAILSWADGRIISVDENAGPGAANAELVDASGFFLAPGFVDIHVHGAAGADYMDGSPEAVRRVNAAHARHGTTSIFPTTTTGSFDQLSRMIESCEIVQADWRPSQGARIAGCHFYGPYFAQDKVGVHPPAGRRDPVKAEYEHFLSKPIVKIATCAAELPGALDFYAFAQAAGCLVTCGHSNADWRELERAFAHGVRHVDHFWCAMSSVSSLRARFGTPMRAGMEQFVIANAAMSTEVIADGVHLSDELLRFAFEVIGKGRTCLVTDANRALDAPAGTYRFGSDMDGAWVYSDGRSVRGEDGSLASSMCGMDHMVRIMARAAGEDLPGVIRMATLTPAERSGVSAEIGSIEPGKRADFVVLTRELEIDAVVIGGEIFFASESSPLRRGLA